MTDPQPSHSIQTYPFRDPPLKTPLIVLKIMQYNLTDSLLHYTPDFTGLTALTSSKCLQNNPQTSVLHIPPFTKKLTYQDLQFYTKNTSNFNNELPLSFILDFSNFKISTSLK